MYIDNIRIVFAIVFLMVVSSVSLGDGMLNENASVVKDIILQHPDLVFEKLEILDTKNSIVKLIEKPFVTERKVTRFRTVKMKKEQSVWTYIPDSVEYFISDCLSDGCSEYAVLEENPIADAQFLTLRDYFKSLNGLRVDIEKINLGSDLPVVRRVVADGRIATIGVYREGGMRYEVVLRVRVDMDVEQLESAYFLLLPDLRGGFSLSAVEMVRQ